jgi:hypothetical protein
MNETEVIKEWGQEGSPKDYLQTEIVHLNAANMGVCSVYILPFVPHKPFRVFFLSHGTDCSRQDFGPDYTPKKYWQWIGG